MPGFEPTTRLVLVTPGESTVSVSLRAASPRERARLAIEELRRHGSEAPREHRVSAVRAADAEVLLLGRSLGADLEVSAFDRRGRPLARPRVLAQRDVREAEEWLLGVLPEPAAASSWYEEWWFWLPVAAVVAGGAATAVYVGTRTPDVTLVGSPR
jgi:hypothetical protein